VISFTAVFGTVDCQKELGISAEVCRAES